VLQPARFARPVFGRLSRIGDQEFKGSAGS